MRKTVFLFLIILVLLLSAGCHQVSPPQEEASSTEESAIDQELVVPGYENVNISFPKLLEKDTDLPKEQILKEVSGELSKYENLTSEKTFSLTGSNSGEQQGIESLFFQGNLFNTAVDSDYIAFSIHFSKQSEKRVSLPEMVQINDEFVSLVRDTALNQAEGEIYERLSEMDISEWKERLLKADSSDSKDFTLLVGGTTLSVLFYLSDDTGKERIMPVANLDLEEYQPFWKWTQTNGNEE